MNPVRLTYAHHFKLKKSIIATLGEKLLRCLCMYISRLFPSKSHIKIYSPFFFLFCLFPPQPYIPPNAFEDSTLADATPSTEFHNPRNRESNRMSRYVIKQGLLEDVKKLLEISESSECTSI